MKIVFSEHARNQMAERNISEDEIIFTLVNPNKTVKQTQEKFQAIKSVTKSGRKFLLVVVYCQTNSIKKVITAFFTTKFKKYLK